MDKDRIIEALLIHDPNRTSVLGAILFLSNDQFDIVIESRQKADQQVR